MRIFITGASGHIGSAVVPELQQADHEVVALARSDRSAETLEKQGADVVRGDLADLATLARAASDADGVIHLAFKHEEMRAGELDAAVAADASAVRALGAALAGSGKPLVISAAVMPLARLPLTGERYTEHDVIPGGPRVDTENEVVAIADRGVRSSAVRMSPVTHSDLDRQGFARVLIGLAQRHGFSAYVGDGANRWPAVNTRDAASLYRLAVESAPAGSRLHAVAEEGIAFREIAEAIGTGLGVETRSIAADQAAEHFTFLGQFVGLDVPVSSAWTRETVGWEPTRDGLIEDLLHGPYVARG